MPAPSLLRHGQCPAGYNFIPQELTTSHLKIVEGYRIMECLVMDAGGGQEEENLFGVALDDFVS